MFKGLNQLFTEEIRVDKNSCSASLVTKCGKYVALQQISKSPKHPGGQYTKVDVHVHCLWGRSWGAHSCEAAVAGNTLHGHSLTKWLCLSESISKIHYGSFLWHTFVKYFLVQWWGEMETLATDQKRNEKLKWICLLLQIKVRCKAIQVSSGKVMSSCSIICVF